MPIFSQNNLMFSSNNNIFKTIWYPNNYDSLIFWSNANKKNVVTTNDTISVWLDNSGNLNNASQSLQTRQPVHVENIINGFPALYFQNNKVLKTELELNNFTIMSVVKASNNDIVYEYGNSTEDYTGFYLYGSTPTIAVSNSGYTNLASVKSYSNNWLSSGNTWKIITHSYNGTSNTHKMYINNIYVSMSTVYGNNPGNLNIKQFLNIGAKSNSTIGINGYIAEFLVFNENIDNDKFKKILKYLNDKYQIF